MNSEIVVACDVLVCSLPAYVLFDSRSSHKFVLAQFASKMNKEYEPLGYELAMSRLTNKGMICSIIYRDCSICINDTIIPTYLILLKIEHVDIIFGMNWLSKMGKYTVHINV